MLNYRQIKNNLTLKTIVKDVNVCKR